MKVLVVEDEADLRTLMRIHLERSGHEVAEAADGVLALEHVEQHGPPDLILLDIRMPRADGWEVLRVLGEQGLLDTIPVIVVSAFAQEDHLERTLEMGGRAFLEKPFSRPDLLQAIASAIPKS